MHSAKVKIVIWAFAAILLVVVLVLGIRRFAFGMDISGAGFVTTYSFPGSEAYEKGSATLPASTDISEFELDWLSGEIDIRFYDGDRISFEETAPRELSEKETLRFIVSGKKLTIRYCEPKTGMDRFMKMPEKSIKVLIPNRFSGIDISIDNVSSSIYIDGNQTALKTLSVDSVSGAITIADVYTPIFKISNISGSIAFKGVGEKTDIETISGGVTLDFDETPKDLRVNSISGDIIVRLGENDGFTATLDSISGRLSCDFAEMTGTKKVVYRNGNASFQFETISGMATIVLSNDMPAKPAVDLVQKQVREDLSPIEEPPPLPSIGPVNEVPVSSGGRKF